MGAGDLPNRLEFPEACPSTGVDVMEFLKYLLSTANLDDAFTKYDKFSNPNLFYKPGNSRILRISGDQGVQITSLGMSIICLPLTFLEGGGFFEGEAIIVQNHVGFPQGIPEWMKELYEAIKASGVT